MALNHNIIKNWRSAELHTSNRHITSCYIEPDGATRKQTWHLLVQPHQSLLWMLVFLCLQLSTLQMMNELSSVLLAIATMQTLMSSA